MPIYDYRCDACGHAFSAVQSYTDETLDTCPQCGAVPRKLMASPAIVFKGSGWYKTDSRRGSSDAKADAKADGKLEAKADPKSEGKSEGKAEGKSEGTGAKPDASAAKPEAAPAKQEKPAEAKPGPAS